MHLCFDFTGGPIAHAMLFIACAITSATASGENINLKVNMFNVLGQQLKTPDNVTFELSGLGKIEGSTFLAPKDAAHTGTTIIAKVAELYLDNVEVTANPQEP